MKAFESKWVNFNHILHGVNSLSPGGLKIIKLQLFYSNLFNYIDNQNNKRKKCWKIKISLNYSN